MEKIGNEWEEYQSKLITNRLEIYDEDGITLRDVIDSSGFKGIRWRDEYVAGSWVSASGGLLLLIQQLIQ